LIEPVSEMGPSSKINFPSLISFFIGLFSNLFFLLNSFFDCHFFSHCFPFVRFSVHSSSSSGDFLGLMYTIWHSP
jgi:hypothetical protein